MILHVRHGMTYHPSCAERVRAFATVKAPTIIGYIYGTALTFDRQGDRGGCTVIDRDGTPDHEAFAPNAFDQSIAGGEQILCLNHDRSRKLSGSFTRLANGAGRLVYRFTLMDGQFERSILDQIRSRRIRHCSIAFVPGEQEWRSSMTVHTRARLTEISLCGASHRPQWFGTQVFVAEVG